MESGLTVIGAAFDGREENIFVGDRNGQNDYFFGHEDELPQRTRTYFLGDLASCSQEAGAFGRQHVKIRRAFDGFSRVVPLDRTPVHTHDDDTDTTFNLRGDAVQDFSENQSRLP